MADSAPPTTHAGPSRTLTATLRDTANPATVKGTVGLVAGVALVVLPDATLSVVEIILGVALLAIGGHDVAFALAGRRIRKHGGSRWLALARGVASIGVGLLVLLSPRDSVSVLVFLIGLYLLARGLVSIGLGLFSRDRNARGVRLTTGGAATALGILAITSPESLAAGLLVGGGLAVALAGALLLFYGLRAGLTDDTPDVATAGTAELLWHWVRSNDIGDERRARLADQLYYEEPDRLPKLAAWWTMLLLSVAIATFAILQDSTAVVIGAMLIAPLMTPILGLAGGIVNGWPTRVIQSARLVVLGVVASVALASVIAAWAPQLVAFDANTQITSRVSPTFVDMLIALAAGAAGAFATVNVRVASSIAGVAIAVALVPPLGVVGVALQSARLDEAFGAFLLFMTNFVSIVLAAALVFVLTGFADTHVLPQQRRRVVSTLAPFASLALIILVPLVFTAQGILASATAQKAAQVVVDDWLGDESGLEVQEVSVDVGLESSVVRVQLSGASRPPSAQQLHTSLTEAFGQDLELTVELFPSSTVTVDESGSEAERGNVERLGG